MPEVGEEQPNLVAVARDRAVVEQHPASLDHARRIPDTPADVLPRVAGAARSGTQIVLLTLAAGQFLMTLDSSVMNVSIATVAKDVGTTVTGIQGAITAYTLVMAALMITGGKIGGLIGRKRAFAIGCVIYGAGSFDDLARAEPAGAAVRLVVPGGRRRGADPAGDRRARRRELPDRAAARRLRARRGRRRDRRRRRPADRRLRHDLLLLALGLRRRGGGRARDPRADAPDRRRSRRRRDRSSTWSAPCSRRSGLALFVFGILRSGEWGWIRPHEGGPSWAHLSPTVWLVLAGLFVIWLFFTVGDPPRGQGQGAADPPRDAAGTRS